MTLRLASIAIATVLGTLDPSSGENVTAPAPRAHHALVYDESRRAVLLTAGSTPLDQGQRFQFFNDLWAYESCQWRRLGESGARVSGVALAYDSRNSRVLSFGGYNGRSLGELRALEGDRWRTLGTHAAMPVAEPGFVYDSNRDRFVAFGGSAGPGLAAGETWEYDGVAWKRVDASGPPARQAHVMVFDSKRGRTVLFGGFGPAPPGQPPPAYGDTWEFDGKHWQEAKAAGPSPRNAAGVAYDSKRGVVILFGGAGAAGFLGDTWSWNGKVWTKLADSGPEPRAMGYLAYDQQRDRVVLFGGRKGWPNGDLGDTWEWDGAVWERREGNCPP